MSKLEQRFFVIPADSNFEKEREAYEENQAQLHAAYVEFAEQVGLEAREALIHPYHIFINSTDCFMRPCQLFIKATAADQEQFGSKAFRSTDECPSGFVQVCINSQLYKDMTAFFFRKGLRFLYRRGLRHLTDDESSFNTFCQEFWLFGRHYGSILAPSVTLDDEVEEISANNYYAALLRHIANGHDVPPFDFTI